MSSNEQYTAITILFPLFCNLLWLYYDCDALTKYIFILFNFTFNYTISNSPKVDFLYLLWAKTLNHMLIVAQWATKRATLGVSLADKIENEVIRLRTKVIDTAHRICTIKWRWLRFDHNNLYIHNIYLTDNVWKM